MEMDLSLWTVYQILKRFWWLNDLASSSNLTEQGPLFPASSTEAYVRPKEESPSWKMSELPKYVNYKLVEYQCSTIRSY